MITNNTISICLTWPQYLAQWYAHDMYRAEHAEDESLPPYVYRCDVPAGMLEIVETRRGSIERNILEMTLSKPEKDYTEPVPDNATIRIALPCFAAKPPTVYNCLKPASQILLEQAVRNRFRIELNKYLTKVYLANRTTIDAAITAFMQNNGIEVSDRNYNAIKKIWCRLQGCRKMREYRKK